MTLTVLNIQGTVDGHIVNFFPTLIQSAERNYLVDCGYEETTKELEIELKTLGLDVKDLNGVIISHDDIDHLGGLHSLKSKNKNLIVYCGEQEKNSVSGIIKSERLVQAENLLDNNPEEDRIWALNFIQKLKNINRYNVNKVLKDNDIFENEIIVVHTPGHTKGHISLFYPDERTLIAGDSLIIENGEFEFANPSFTLDMKQAIKSAERIKHLDPFRIICYHGGIMEENVGVKLKTLINKYKNY